MCDAKNKLLDLMLPYIDEYNKDEEELKTKEQKLYSLNNLLSLVDKDYLKYLEYDNDELLKEMLDGYNGDITKYNACKYILSAPYEEIKTIPQYLDAVKYIEGLYNYTRAYYDDYVLEYQEVYKKHQINVLINKYYDILKNGNSYIQDVNELEILFNKFNFNLDERIEVIASILKTNNDNYHEIVLEENEEEDISELEKILKTNDKYLDNKYQELLNVINDYIDITKPLDKTVKESVLKKVNINNILLAKKVWLIKTAKASFARKNYNKTKKNLDEFDYVDGLLNSIKNIKDKKEAIRIIKGD